MLFVCVRSICVGALLCAAALRLRFLMTYFFFLLMRCALDGQRPHGGEGAPGLLLFPLEFAHFRANPFLFSSYKKI